MPNSVRFFWGVATLKTGMQVQLTRIQEAVPST